MIEEFSNDERDDLDDEDMETEEQYLEDDDDSVKDADFSLEKEMQQSGGYDDDDDDDLDDQIDENGSIRFNDLNFVKIIKSVGQCLLQKSQTPPMKKKKKQALQNVVSECLSKFGTALTEQQAKRKLDNLKSRVKTKIDRKKTGNLPIKLNDADELLLALLDAEENPSITQVSCKHFKFILYS